MERRRQTSLSIALGARPYRVISQTLTESILLSLFGGAAGLGLAFGYTRLIFTFHVRIVWSLDQRLSFHAGAIVRAGRFIDHGNRAFGVAPAWMATRVDPI